MRAHYLANLVLLGCMLGAFLWFYFRKEKPPGGLKKTVALRMSHPLGHHGKMKKCIENSDG